MREELVHSIISLAYENVRAGAETLSEVRNVMARIEGLSSAERQSIAHACHDFCELSQRVQEPYLRLAYPS